MGDEVLKVVAKNLEKKLRRADIVCRYGGEEFVIILPEINCNHASIVAEKLRSSIDAFRYKDNNNHEHHITISIGVACFPDHGPDIEGIMESADQALYEAKKCGRNLVRIAC